jgi:Holliday junction resolvasome RuvABC endonuclease subunit
MRERNNYKILSLKPSTKQMSIAVLDNQDLVYWRNKKIRKKKLLESQVLKSLKNTLDKLIEFWKPNIIAVEDIHYTQAKKSSLLNSLTRKIKDISRERKIRVYFFSPIEARKFFCQNEKANKLNTAKVLAEKYPWLYQKYEKENKKRWYQFKFGLRVFDAIAVGLFCFYQLKRKETKTYDKD